MMVLSGHFPLLFKKGGAATPPFVIGRQVMCNGAVLSAGNETSGGSASAKNTLIRTLAGG